MIRGEFVRKILLVEDDKSIVMGLDFLLSQDYDLSIATSKKQAMEKLGFNYDLIIMDIMLKDGNGLSIASEIKDVPILFLTAKDDEQSIIDGLSLGEDYLTKPFRNKELLARIQKILARNNRSVIYCGKISLDTDKKDIKINNTAITLTIIEYKILELLIKNKNKVVARERILEHIWDYNENYVNDNTLTVNIKRIRAKTFTDIIKTVKGFGYMVDENEC